MQLYYCVTCVYDYNFLKTMSGFAAPGFLIFFLGIDFRFCNDTHYVVWKKWYIPQITTTIRLQLALTHFSQTSLWSPASGCPEVAISWLEWEGLSVHSSKCDDWLDTWVIIDPFRAFSRSVCLARCPKKVTSTWDNIYTTISCLAGLLWMQE